MNSTALGATAGIWLIFLKLENWMKNWLLQKLQQPLNMVRFRRYDILKDNGRISHKQALDKAYAEYEIFNRTQPIESDFDRIVKKLNETSER